MLDSSSCLPGALTCPDQINLPSRTSARHHTDNLCHFSQSIAVHVTGKSPVEAPLVQAPRMQATTVIGSFVVLTLHSNMLMHLVLTAMSLLLGAGNTPRRTWWQQL